MTLHCSIQITFHYLAFVGTKGRTCEKYQNHWLPLWQHITQPKFLCKFIIDCLMGFHLAFQCCAFIFICSNMSLFKSYIHTRFIRCAVYSRRLDVVCTFLYAHVHDANYTVHDYLCIYFIIVQVRNCSLTWQTVVSLCVVVEKTV